MSRRKEIALVTAASAGLMANISSQKFYVNEECIPLQAYEINGSNYVKLRDIGQALDFSVTYAAKTNTVRINPNKPYEEGVAPPLRTQQKSGRLHQCPPGWWPVHPAVGRCGPLRQELLRGRTGGFPSGSRPRLEPIRSAGAAQG